MDGLFIKKLKSFLDQTIQDIGLTRANLFVVRPDGIPLYPEEDTYAYDTSAIGPLVGGTWQAARELAKLISQDQNDFFRLSFDTTSKGVYILPLQTDTSEFYLGILYKDQLNPGQLKVKVRGLWHKLNQFLKENSVGPKNSDRQKDPIDKNYLFSDVTDEEVDQLFSSF